MFQDNGLQFSFDIPRYPPFHPSAHNYRVAPAAPQSLPLPPLRRAIPREDNAEPVVARDGVQPATRTVASCNFTLVNEKCAREWSRANVPILIHRLSYVSRVADDRIANLASHSSSVQSLASRKKRREEQWQSNNNGQQAEEEAWRGFV